MRLTKYLLIFSVLLITSFGYAQTLKTDVVVVGGTQSGVAAAIQAAHSGVKTLLLLETNEFVKNFSTPLDTGFFSGIQISFLNTSLKIRRDTLSGVVAPLTQSVVQSTLKGWTDTIKNLTVLPNVAWQKIERKGKDWEIKLKDGKTIKATVVVDATVGGTLASRAELITDPTTGYFKTVATINQIDRLNPYNNKLYRTAVGIGSSERNSPFIIPLGSLIALGVDNFILAGKLPSLVSAKNLEKGTMELGQAAGASAAYCAFFKTTTQSLNVRVIQGELFAYKSWLVPFRDIFPTDSNFLAIEQIAVSGLLKGKFVKKQLFFEPDSLVSIEDLRIPMREFYTRSQLWFADNKDVQFTVGTFLSLIKFAASRGAELDREVEKAWKTSFKFTSDYDPKRLITKRELAVLANAYLKPFNTRVDLSGNLIN